MFGQNLRLEPLETEKRGLWKREMNCLLSVCDYIVEFIPRCQSLSNGTTVEVMESRPRADIYINLPALRKLDSMLMVPTHLNDYYEDPFSMIMIFFFCFSTGSIG